MIPQPPLFVRDQVKPEVLDDWLASRRDVIARDGYALRAGHGRRGATIEVKSLTPHELLAADDPLRVNVWCVMALPEGAREFAREEERDEVLQLLIGPHGGGEGNNR